MPDVLVWLYNSRTGTVIQNAKPLALISLKSGLGWHGPFDTKELAVAYYNSKKGSNPGWVAPTGFFDSVGNIPDAIGEGAKDAGDAVGSAVVDRLGFSNENITSWMIRIGEILLGIVLVGVGIAKLTGTTNAVSKIVKAKI